jgi:hypothetical protein
MAKTIWVVEGVGDANPRKELVNQTETVGSFKRKYAGKLGMSPNEIELATDTSRLLNEEELLTKVVADGDTLNVTPRAKAGAL